MRGQARREDTQRNPRDRQGKGFVVEWWWVVVDDDGGRSEIWQKSAVGSPWKSSDKLTSATPQAKIWLKGVTTWELAGGGCWT